MDAPITIRYKETLRFLKLADNVVPLVLWELRKQFTSPTFTTILNNVMHEHYKIEGDIDTRPTTESEEARDDPDAVLGAFRVDTNRIVRPLNHLFGSLAVLFAGDGEMAWHDSPFFARVCNIIKPDWLPPYSTNQLNLYSDYNEAESGTTGPGTPMGSDIRKKIVELMTIEVVVPRDDAAMDDDTESIYDKRGMDLWCAYIPDSHLRCATIHIACAMASVFSKTQSVYNIGHNTVAFIKNTQPKVGQAFHLQFDADNMFDPREGVGSEMKKIVDPLLKMYSSETYKQNAAKTRKGIMSKYVSRSFIAALGSLIKAQNTPSEYNTIRRGDVDKMLSENAPSVDGAESSSTRQDCARPAPVLPIIANADIYNKLGTLVTDSNALTNASLYTAAHANDIRKTVVDGFVDSIAMGVYVDAYGCQRYSTHEPSNDFRRGWPSSYDYIS